MEIYIHCLRHVGGHQHSLTCERQKHYQARIVETYTHRVVMPQGHGTLSRAPLQELYDPSMETSTANLDDLQRSWETLKNVVCHIIGYMVKWTFPPASPLLLTSFTSFFPTPFLQTQISEKQKSLYEALERQQHYQESLQSISTKMESIEGALNEGLEPNKSPESHMAAHQVREIGGTEDRGVGCSADNKTDSGTAC